MKKHMNITVAGGGNIGSAIAGNLSMLDNVCMTLWTSKPERFLNKLHIVDREKNKEYDSNELVITGCAKDAIRDADVILCTLPAFVRESFVNQIAKFIKKGALLGFVPGSGGVEFICKGLIDSSVTVFGLQRVPYTCRVLEYGKICAINSTKPYIYAAAMPSSATGQISQLMQYLFQIPCVSLHNYAEVTLVPSNAILHTSRNYQIFKDYTPGRLYDRNPYFYLDWNDEASEVLLSCDSELQTICKSFTELDLSGVHSLKKHYESATASQLTDKLSNMPAYKRSATLSPMIESTPGQWEPDWESRYFIEDFPFGLAVIKGFAHIAGVNTPSIDKVLHWYQGISGQTYFDNAGEPGKHISNCGAPQRYGYQSKNQITSLYL